jgi:hypothetical protein
MFKSQYDNTYQYFYKRLQEAFEENIEGFELDLFAYDPNNYLS